MKYMKKYNSTLPNPKVGIEGIWNGINIKFQHQTTLQLQSLRSTSSCVIRVSSNDTTTVVVISCVIRVSLNMKHYNTGVPNTVSEIF